MSQIGKNLKSTVLGSKKLLVFLGLLILVVIGYVLSSSPEPNVARSQVPSGGLGRDIPVQGVVENNPVYNTELDKNDSDVFDQAKATGATAIPTLRANPTQVSTPVLVTPEPTPAVPVIENPEPQITQQPILVQAPINNVPIVAPPNANRIADNKARVDSMAKYMAEMRRPIPTASVTTFGNPSDFIKEEPQQSASVAQTTSGTAQQQSKITLPLSGKILYAELVGRANSDVPGPVIAKVLQGEYAGATLIGSFKAAREHLVISFDKMTVETTANGEEINETISISAVAVDTSNIGTGLATSVDRHLFQKLAIGFTSAFAQGLGDAIGDKGSTTYNTSNGTITTRNGDLNTEEQLLSAGGQAIAKGGSILDSEFGNRPTTIIVEGGTAIGVLFL
jgi:intracellular multiplication protein IcmE